MKTANLTITLLAGASMLALGAGPALAGSGASVGAETKVEAGASVDTEGRALNEAEKNDVTAEEIADKTGKALEAAGKATSQAAISAETTIRELFSSNDIKSVEGTAVRDMAGESVGEVDGVVRSKTTNEVFFVVDVGGFLGLGEREVAVPADRFTAGDGHLKLDTISKAQLETYDEYNAAFYNAVSVKSNGSIGAAID